ncbi:MAG: HK97 family phage prohead protease [Pseudomonadota bacterium]
MISEPANGQEGDFHFSGYASLFSIADLSNDRVMMGAFHRSLQARGVTGIRMLWNHDPAEPIGVWTAIDEDARGLRVTGRLTRGVTRSSALRALIEDRAVDGLSIGFHTVRADRPKGGSGRRLIEIDLWEISLVAFPMQPGARIDPPPMPVQPFFPGDPATPATLQPAHLSQTSRALHTSHTAKGHF